MIVTGRGNNRVYWFGPETHPPKADDGSDLEVLVVYDDNWAIAPNPSPKFGFGSFSTLDNYWRLQGYPWEPKIILWKFLDPLPGRKEAISTRTVTRFIRRYGRKS